MYSRILFKVNDNYDSATGKIGALIGITQIIGFWLFIESLECLNSLNELCVAGNKSSGQKFKSL